MKDSQPSHEDRRGLTPVGKLAILAVVILAIVLLAICARWGWYLLGRHIASHVGEGPLPTPVDPGTMESLKPGGFGPPDVTKTTKDADQPTVADYARRSGLEPTKTLDLGNGVKLEMVLIPAGKFLMGSPETEENREKDETQHEVTISRPYYLGKFEVTQEQYQQIMGVNPSHFRGRDLPVEEVLWDDAQGFCKKASEKTGLTLRLPTEAEWEYACRAGTKTAFYTGDAETDLDRAAWYYKNSGKKTHPVGQKAANAWGLYDMHGNDWEWCQDLYEPYKAEAVVDPQGPAQGAGHVLRGGTWFLDPRHCRSAYRLRDHPDDRNVSLGFRVVASVPSKAP